MAAVVVYVWLTVFSSVQFSRYARDAPVRVGFSLLFGGFPNGNRRYGTSTPTTTYTHTHTHTHTHIVKPEAPETSPCLGGPKTLSLELPGTRVQCNRVPLCVTRVPWAQRQYFLRPVLWPVLRPIALSPLPRIGICSIRVSSAPWSSAGRGLVSFERPP